MNLIIDLQYFPTVILFKNSLTNMLLNKLRSIIAYINSLYINSLLYKRLFDLILILIRRILI